MSHLGSTSERSGIAGQWRNQHRNLVPKPQLINIKANFVALSIFAGVDGTFRPIGGGPITARGMCKNIFSISS